MRIPIGPPLYYASLLGLLDSIEALIEKGAHVNAQGGLHCNALQAASTTGYFEVVQLLLEKGAVVDPKILLAALRQGQERVLRMLFDHGCHLEQTDMEGRQMCHYACIIGNTKAVEMLIDRGTDLTVTDKQGRNCLHFAAASSDSGSPGLVTMLLKQGFNPNSRDYNDWTPLHWAAKGGVAENLKILEDAGAKFSIENIGGRTPSDVAVFHECDVTWRFNVATNPCFKEGVRNEAVCDGCKQVCRPWK